MAVALVLVEEELRLERPQKNTDICLTMNASSEPYKNCLVSMSMIQDSSERGEALTWTRALVRGDEEAFQLLYDWYYTRLYRYLLVIASGEESCAQEALQQTMIRVARKVKPMTSHEDFWRWLTVVARNAHRDLIRKQGRYRGMLSRFSDWFSLGVDHDSGSVPQKIEQMYDEVLQNVIGALKSEDRTLIEEKHFDGLSVKDIAQKCKMTPKAVESKLTRLRLRIKHELLKRLGDEELP
jgi:RNA polymerase sigma factor (sigma-70 family)